jgi:AAA15 family ATPase/GTPase
VKVINNIEGQSKSELIKTVSIQQEHDIQREGYIKSLQSELDSLREQLAKANERVKQLEKDSKDAFISFAKNHKSVDGKSALFIHALGVAFNKEKLRKEKPQCK